MSKHTPGPLRLIESSDYYGLQTSDEDVLIRLRPMNLPHDEAEANAARLVACWNAMDGIEDPVAARVVLDEPQTQHARDMLAMLKQLTQLHLHCKSGERVCDACKLIKKVQS